MVPADAFAAFGSSAVFFILGVFYSRRGVDPLWPQCAASAPLPPAVRSHAVHAATGVTLIACLLTAFMPAQAAVAMLFPIVTELAIAMRLPRGASSYGKVSSSPSPGCDGRIERQLPREHPCAARTRDAREDAWHDRRLHPLADATLPLVLLGAAAVQFFARLALPGETIDITAARAQWSTQLRGSGRMGREQVTVMIIMLATVLGWVALGGSRSTFAVLALLGATAMFGFRVLAWEDLEGYIHWNLILMYGGAIARGVAIDRTGLGRWLVHAAIGGLRVPPYSPSSESRSALCCCRSS
jgi:sodium-dependent dicarboxylate transporter 2/3/5